MVEKSKDTPNTMSKADLLEGFRTLSIALTRAQLGGRLGKSYGTDRDIYEALGYTKVPVFNDYMSRYRRQDIARAIINKPVAYSWLKSPIISESDDDDTEFEAAWEALVKDKRVLHYMTRVDRLAGIGSYAVLVIGADDDRPPNEPLEKASQLLYLTPASMANASISTSENDPQNERFNLPVLYNVKFGTEGNSMLVHHTRVIHVAEDKLEDDVEGIPKLEAVLNRLQDLELIVGGSAEMFWRGGFPGYQFKVDPDATLGTQTLADLQTEMENFLHGLQRYVRTTGMSVEAIAQELADPTGNVSVELDMISAATGIPKRILIGSERGELASTQDEQAWLDTIDARRRQHCEPTILRPTIDRLIEVGILPEPRDGYTVEWPDLMNKGDKEIADVAATRSQAMKNYLDSGADEIMPPEIFLEKIMGFSGEDIEKIKTILEEIDREMAPEPIEDDDGGDE